MEQIKTHDQMRLEHRLFFVREARRRGMSKWSRDFWDLAETKLIRQYIRTQNLRGVEEYAELV